MLSTTTFPFIGIRVTFVPMYTRFIKIGYCKNFKYSSSPSNVFLSINQSINQPVVQQHICVLSFQLVCTLDKEWQQPVKALLIFYFLENNFLSMVDYTVHYACTFHLSKHSSCKPIRNYRLCDFGKSLDMTKIHCKTHKPTGYSKSNFIFNNCKLFKKKEVFMTCITDQIRLCACHNKCFFF